MKPHDCRWTRRKESEISDDGVSLHGAGVPPHVLEGTAEALGCRLEREPSVDDEYGSAIVIGTVARGAIHDGCFFRLDPVSASLKRALVESLLELHATYLGTSFDRGAIRPVVLERFDTGTTIRLRSDSKRRCLTLRRYPTDSGFWARLRARPLRLRLTAG